MHQVAFGICSDPHIQQKKKRCKNSWNKVAFWLLQGYFFIWTHHKCSYSSHQGKDLLFQQKTSLNKQTPGFGAEGRSEMAVWRDRNDAPSLASLESTKSTFIPMTLCSWRAGIQLGTLSIEPQKGGECLLVGSSTSRRKSYSNSYKTEANNRTMESE